MNDDLTLIIESKLGKFVCLKPSGIEGNGLFAKKNIPEGTRIHVSHIWGSRYGWINLDPNYKFNHSGAEPNSRLVTSDNIKELIASKDIPEGEEVVADYTEDNAVSQPEANWK